MDSSNSRADEGTTAAGEARVRRFTRELRLTFGSLLLGALVAGGTLYLDWVGEGRPAPAVVVPIAQSMRNLSGFAYDLALTQRVRRRQSEAADSRIVLVVISDGTRSELTPDYLLPGLDRELRELLGEPPGTFVERQRDYHAVLLRKLKLLGAQTVVFDIVFDAEMERDRHFAAAIKESGNVVLGAVLAGAEASVQSDAPLEQNLRYLMPNYRLREHAAAVGIAMLPEDKGDRTLRRFDWFRKGLSETGNAVWIPSLPLAAAAVVEGLDPLAAASQAADEGRFGTTRIEFVPGTDSSLIDYGGARGQTYREYRYEDVVAWDPTGMDDFAATFGDEFRDKIVFVGEISRASQDWHRIPLPPPSKAVLRELGAIDTGTEDKIPGVEIQANATQTILDGAFIRTLERKIAGWLLLLVALAVAMLARGLRPLLAVAGLLALLALPVLVSNYLLATAAIWHNPVPMTASSLGTFGVSLVYMYIAERRQQALVRAKFSNIVGPDVMRDMLREGRPELAGEGREITLLFSDLQGFTTISERMTPAEVCEMLNSYFDPMIDTIFAYDGTLDKLMGDGIMAYFGAPRRDTEHAIKAVRCAIAMQEALDDWRNVPEHRDLPELRMRIGIHTGHAIFGEMGGRRQRDYSCIGDPVNLASRLEGVNKDYGTLILISEVTYGLVKDQIRAEYRGNVAVKGREEPIGVYSVDPADPFVDAGGAASARQPPTVTA